jgi:thiamine pyrophosphokinase
MKACALFLNGRYAKKDLPFYRALCPGRFTVAVDGGYKFFRALSIHPDLLIGDFDSIGKIPADLPKSTMVERFPLMKDKTDAELALDYCMARKAKQIDIVQPSYGEPDQLLGNFLLLLVAARKGDKHYRPKIRLLNARYEVRLLYDSRATIANAIGDVVSVLPVSERIRLSTTGTSYDVRKVEILRGRSLGMRNRLRAKSATFRIEGMALLVRQFGKKKRQLSK